MRLILVVGLAVGLSISATFTSAEVVNNTSKDKRVISRTGLEHLKWFQAPSPQRVVRHSEHEVSRVMTLAGQEMLGQLVVNDGDVNRYGVVIGGNESLGPVASLDAARPVKNAPADSPWVSVVRHSGGQTETQVLAVANHLIFDSISRQSVPRLIRVQREYALTNTTTELNVRLVGTQLRVKRNRAGGIFEVNGAMLGTIVGFKATAELLSVITTAQVQYDFDINEVAGALTFTPAVRPFSDASALLRTQSQTSPADVIEPKESESAGTCGPEFTN